ncbi:glucose-1-phosphate cytidylyltransferase [Desulfohalobiaceae bacterium Ax17]|uniref:glucose-1-phosphate cytidylyltransferase n=1 Tax=Desulfovulcanus ferrireducens TaxID=2831190 RepID=UPI00207BA08A|nr:glucose-1-phosphate cytidylyltransferase [Desulfovulcanus ferrireducens]MBT8763353.1 glucose-1-phosphate cytidylyltransferase [Desulfovulcanus ferrireducens]
MKVVILCGGLGTRLREETEFRPKSMVSIGNRPILWHIMKSYAQYGLTEFILALGYKGEIIKEYFYHYEIMNNDVTIELGRPEHLCLHDRHSEIGWKITLANTGERALKGARLKKVEKYISDETFMLTYGDGLANIDLNTLLSFHKSHGKIATVTGVNPAARFGELKISCNQVTAFFEKPKNSDKNLINGGFFVFNRKIFDYLTTDENCDLEHGPLEEIAQEGQLMVYKHTGFWACMDTVRDMEYLNKMWTEGKAAWKNW